MERRSFLSGLTAALLAAPIEARASLPEARVEQDDRQRLDTDTRHLSQRRSRLTPVLRRHGLPDDFLGRQLAAMMVVDSFQLASAEEQKAPHWRRRLQDAGLTLAEGSARLVTIPEGLSRGAKRRLGFALRRPTRVTALIERVLGDPDQPLPPGRHEQLRSGLAGLAASIRDRPPAELTDDIITNFDQLAQDLELTRGEGGALEPAKDDDTWFHHRKIMLGLGMMSGAALLYGLGNLLFILGVDTKPRQGLMSAGLISCALGALLFAAGFLVFITGWTEWLTADDDDAEHSPQEQQLIFLTEGLRLA